MQERFIYIRSAYRKFIDDIASFIFLDEELEKADVIFISGGHILKLQRMPQNNFDCE